MWLARLVQIEVKAMYSDKRTFKSREELDKFISDNKDMFDYLHYARSEKHVIEF